MALLERLQRRATDVGLLPWLVQLLPRLALLSGLVGLAWLALWLPLEGNYRHTYISENALMPSQAYSYFRETEWNLLRGFRTQIKQLVNETSSSRNEIVGSWLEEIGVKTAIHTDSDNGDTLYGVLHAPRGDGTEAMVLAAPWHNGDGDFNLGGTALATALTRYFSRWPLWSKNIIVVFSEDPKASLRSWCNAYHSSLDLTGGSIESAVVLDYPGANDFFKYVEIYYAGLNGELPNLDLVNVAVHVTEHEGMPVSINGNPESEIGDSDFYAKMRKMLLGVQKMALSGVQTCYGNEAFSGYRIQSLVVKARGTGGPFDITTFGRIPEAMFRSVNNLLEKFHQSFFFYLLLAPRYFVSIASYLPAAGAFSVSFILAGLDNYLNSAKGLSSTSNSSYYSVVTILAFVVSLLAAFTLSQVFLQWTKPLVLVTISLLVSSVPLLPIKSKFTTVYAYRFKSIAFMYLSVVLTSLLVVNFALAFGIGLLAFPMILIKNTNSLKLRFKNSLMLMATNPFVCTCIFANVFEARLQGLVVIERLISAWTQLGCWSWFVICIGWLPVWLMVVFSSIPSADERRSVQSANAKKLQ
ncbi:LANO_0C06348g1_1 [Lachancea nothofagi CBS 11611]|uniref:LANO_0C06348g1_1 n=1 Tax=Lachancea nothofagi CBS 11611 TaxID=1266666 RepID=A0A1G4J7V4_9SACH|nr:LANO_0C06348g1_1 [Lachancea nothofagi CBS 11611]